MVVSVCSGTRLNITDISIQVPWPFRYRKESFSAMLTDASRGEIMTSLV